MKKIFMFLMLCFSPLMATDVAPLKPLWDEDLHFLYYRSILIMNNVARIDDLIQEAKEHPENIKTILYEMEVITIMLMHTCGNVSRQSENR
jgi:hypothetical protein